jgi:hypothetical protein
VELGSRGRGGQARTFGGRSRRDGGPFLTSLLGCAIVYDKYNASDCLSKTMNQVWRRENGESDGESDGHLI